MKIGLGTLVPDKITREVLFVESGGCLAVPVELYRRVVTSARDWQGVREPAEVAEV